MPDVTGVNGSAQAQAAAANEATTEMKAKKLNQAANESFGSMEDLKEKEPALYKMLMDGQVVTFINRDKRHWERIKQLAREARRNSGQA